MKFVDANVLLYAVNADDPHHEPSRAWLDRSLSGDDTVAFTWLVLLAFTRLATKVGLFPAPLSVDQALDRVDAWLLPRSSVLIEPGPGHLRRVRALLADLGVGGNLVNDAHLAALAVEHKSEIVSWDHDFDRFAGLRWRRPSDLAPPGS